MNLSHSESPSPTKSAYTESSPQSISITPVTVTPLYPQLPNTAGKSLSLGCMDDARRIREILVRSIKQSGKTRASIAEEMQYLLGRTVTEKMLNAFTADSRDDRRWPSEFNRAFCESTGDTTLLTFFAELSGYKVISGDEVHLLELGRQYLMRKRSEAELAELERRLEGKLL